MSTVLPSPGLPAGDAEPRRAARRHRVLKTARIVINDHTTFDCTLRDMSDTGAKVMVANALSMPATFRLVIPSEGIVRQVRLAWKQQNSCGVIFEGAPLPYHKR